MDSFFYTFFFFLESSVPKDFQNNTDALVSAVDSSVDCKYMKMYLKARFTLEKDVAAHEMVF